MEQQKHSKVMDQIDVNNFHLAYSDASNLVRKQERYTGNDLVEDILHFEQNSKVLEVDTRFIKRNLMNLVLTSPEGLLPKSMLLL